MDTASRDQLIDILNSLNRRIGALELDPEGGNYGEARECKEMIAELEKMMKAGYSA